MGCVPVRVTFCTTMSRRKASSSGQDSGEKTNAPIGRVIGKRDPPAS
jgi:hypothetical protein